MPDVISELSSIILFCESVISELYFEVSIEFENTSLFENLDVSFLKSIVLSFIIICESVNLSIL